MEAGMAIAYLIGGLAGGMIIGALATGLLMRISQHRQLLELNGKLNESAQQRIAAETRLEEKAKAWAEAEATLKEVFDAAAAAALRNNNQSFIDLASKTFENLAAKSQGELGKRQEAIEQMLKPFRESLDKHEKLTAELEKSTKETFGGLRNYLDQLKESQQNLAKETNALVTALKSPKVRGRWGEIGLKRIVEFSGMSAYCDFTEQQSVTSDDGRLRPDMIVRLPGNRSVVVDSKVPLNAFLEALEHDEEESRRRLLAKHASDLRGHMVKLGSKSYWAEFDNTVDFVVLYIEIESAFGAAVIQDRELILDGIRNRIMFATPTTLITLLRTIALSWKQQAVTENALKIFETGRDLYERICSFGDHLNGVGQGLAGAVKSFNAAVGSYESRVLPGARKMKDLGAGSEKKELAVPESLDAILRETKKTDTAAEKET